MYVQVKSVSSVEWSVCIQYQNDVRLVGEGVKWSEHTSVSPIQS